MALIKSDRSKPKLRAIVNSAEEIPFVSAIDLLQQNSGKRLKPAEAAAVGLALYLLTSTEDSSQSRWALAARLGGIASRH